MYVGICEFYFYLWIPCQLLRLIISYKLIAESREEIVDLLSRRKHFCKLKSVFVLFHQMRLVVINWKMNEDGILIYRAWFFWIPSKCFLLPTSTNPTILFIATAFYCFHTIYSVLDKPIIHIFSFTLGFRHLQEPF